MHIQGASLGPDMQLLDVDTLPGQHDAHANILIALSGHEKLQHPLVQREGTIQAGLLQAAVRPDVEIERAGAVRDAGDHAL